MMTNQEYNLTIMSLEWEDGQEYMMQIGYEDSFKVVVFRGELSFVDDDGCMGQDVIRCYALKEIALASFERCIDYWSKVPVDTKILVRDSEDDAWKRRYFAEYEDGEIYAWHGGKTSWSAKYPYSISSWKYAKLATEED